MQKKHRVRVLTTTLVNVETMAIADIEHLPIERLDIGVERPHLRFRPDATGPLAFIFGQQLLPNADVIWRDLDQLIII